MYIPAGYQATPQQELEIKGYSYVLYAGLGAIIMFALHKLNLHESAGFVGQYVFWGTLVLYYVCLGVTALGAGMLCWHYLWLHPVGRWVTMKILYLIGAALIGLAIALLIEPLSAIILLACAIASMIAFEDKLSRQG